MMLEIVKNKLKMLNMIFSLKELDNINREALEKNSSNLEYLSSLLETEIVGREIKRVELRVKQACFPVLKTIGDFDFSIRPELNHNEILSLCDGIFCNNKENRILIGNPGLGKTHLSIGIAYELCKKDKKVLFTTASGLINKLREAKDEKILGKYFKNANKLDLVVIDEIGYFPYEKESSELLFQYISERYERGSLILTTNLPFSKWNEIFYTERLTTAILDRIIHHCSIFELSGESYRFNQSIERKKRGKK